LKVKFNNVAEMMEPLVGETRATDGPAVVIVKLLVALMPVLLAALVQETFQ
jgi:hypothetical protein